MAKYAILLLKQGFINKFRTIYPNAPTVKDKVLNGKKIWAAFLRFLKLKNHPFL